MNDVRESTLIEALDLLERGLSVDEIVARYPAEADSLRAHLRTAAALATLAYQPDVVTQRSSRAEFLAASDSLAAARAPLAPVARTWLRRLAMPALILALVFFVGGASLIGASGAAMPGSALYGVKRGVEEARVILSTNPERAAALLEQFRQERVREIERLLATNTAATVELSGVIDAMDGDRWRVEGVPVVLAAGVVVEGTPAIGATVRVEGQTAGGALVAGRIVVLSSAPAPTPMPSPQPSPTPTTPPTATAEPTRPIGGDDAPISTPESRPESSPTAGPTIAASPTPDDDDIDDDDDDDDVDDDDDDNDDDDSDDDDKDDDDQESARDNHRDRSEQHD
ncbi:MAG TPA: DUF5667 domain-containing protein [Promineifilum sp.]|nr:DUF5667 domain-containing protein [Promineifilum sp.]